MSPNIAKCSWGSDGGGGGVKLSAEKKYPRTNGPMLNEKEILREKKGKGKNGQHLL